MTDNKIKTFFSSFLAAVFLGSNYLSTHVNFKLAALIVSHDRSVLRKTDCQWAKVGNGYLIHYYIAVCLSPSLLLHSFHSLNVFNIPRVKGCTSQIMFLFPLNVVSMEIARIPDGEVRTLID